MKKKGAYRVILRTRLGQSEQENVGILVKEKNIGEILIVGNFNLKVAEMI